MARSAGKKITVRNNTLSEVVRKVWLYLEGQIAEGKTEVTFPKDIKTIIGQAGVNQLRTRYEYVASPLLNKQANGSREFTGLGSQVREKDGIMLVLPAIATRGVLFGARSPSNAGKAHIPRPPNAFILYRKFQQVSVKERFPDMENNDICKYSDLL